MIPKPKGSVGAAGFSLIAEMKLNKHDLADKTLYNDILASVRALAIGAGIDLGRRYKDQSITKLSKLMHAAKEAEPYLARFTDDWATGQILRQYINGKHKYENAKANGKVKVGWKRNKMGTTRLPGLGDEVENVDYDGNSDDNASYDMEEWTGIGSYGRAMDRALGGNGENEGEGVVFGGLHSDVDN